MNILFQSPSKSAVKLASQFAETNQAASPGGSSLGGIPSSSSSVLQSSPGGNTLALAYLSTFGGGVQGQLLAGSLGGGGSSTGTTGFAGWLGGGDQGLFLTNSLTLSDAGFGTGYVRNNGQGSLWSTMLGGSHSTPGTTPQGGSAQTLLPSNVLGTGSAGPTYSEAFKGGISW